MEITVNLDYTGMLLFDLQTGEADETHTHDHFQLSIPLSGELLTYHNHKTQKLKKTQSLLVPPGDIHQHEAHQERKEIMLVSFYEDIIKRTYQKQTGETLHSIDFAYIQPTSQKILNKARTIMQNVAFNGLDVASNLEEELTYIILDETIGSHTKRWNASKRETSNLATPIVDTIKEYIRTHYQNDITLDTLALQMNMSKYHLHRIFSASVGMTPNEYIHRVRLEQATHLLNKHSYDITQVAYEVGYRSISTFNRSFKKVYHQTPSQYMK
ncbi:AraC family transcriptional regulator [Bacillus solimangrovi]|uniref:HTH araC/xylS-type domain-containing protein n=1 Tax=Bacillus solimangrovi TaxID=1305675 RepID=A0A1E5LI33_9BACI|nr:AraC family transcriptional regulator [Bacillus solimangrovi]OEH93743.1 hypothetical protein BFG57_11190 [Bacillus solimangrovi]